MERLRRLGMAAAFVASGCAELERRGVSAGVDTSSEDTAVDSGTDTGADTGDSAVDTTDTSGTDTDTGVVDTSDSGGTDTVDTGTTDTAPVDSDGDGYADTEDCAPFIETVHPDETYQLTGYNWWMDVPSLASDNDDVVDACDTTTGKPGIIEVNAGVGRMPTDEEVAATYNALTSHLDDGSLWLQATSGRVPAELVVVESPVVDAEGNIMMKVYASEAAFSETADTSDTAS